MTGLPPTTPRVLFFLSKRCSYQLHASIYNILFSKNVKESSADRLYYAQGWKHEGEFFTFHVTKDWNQLKLIALRQETSRCYKHAINQN